VTEGEPGDEEDPASSGRGAVYVSQAYYYVVAAVGLLFLLGGAIAALIALRKWILPISETADRSGFLGTSVDTMRRDPSSARSPSRSPARSCSHGISARLGGVKGVPGFERPGAASCSSIWWRWSRW
jgi:hypothetical protein